MVKTMTLFNRKFKKREALCTLIFPLIPLFIQPMTYDSGFGCMYFNNRPADFESSTIGSKLGELRERRDQVGFQPLWKQSGYAVHIACKYISIRDHCTRQVHHNIWCDFRFQNRKITFSDGGAYFQKNETKYKVEKLSSWLMINQSNE